MSALTIAQVAEQTGYTVRSIRELTRTGRFPAPIDPELGPRMWRWAPNAVDQYIRGEWPTKAAS